MTLVTMVGLNLLKNLNLSPDLQKILNCINNSFSHFTIRTFFSGSLVSPLASLPSVRDTLVPIHNKTAEYDRSTRTKEMVVFSRLLIYVSWWQKMPVSDSLEAIAMRQEAKRFESVCPNIQSLYDLLERIDSVPLKRKIRELVNRIEGKWIIDCRLYVVDFWRKYM